MWSRSGEPVGVGAPAAVALGVAVGVVAADGVVAAGGKRGIVPPRTAAGVGVAAGEAVGVRVGVRVGVMVAVGVGVAAGGGSPSATAGLPRLNDPSPRWAKLLFGAALNQPVPPVEQVFDWQAK